MLTKGSREEISFDYLSDLIGNRGDVHEICPDMAFFLDHQKGPDKKPVIRDMAKPLVALTLRNWSFPDQKCNESRLAKREEYMTSLMDQGIAYAVKNSGGTVTTAQIEEHLPKLSKGYQKSLLLGLHLNNLRSAQELIQIVREKKIV